LSHACLGAASKRCFEQVIFEARSNDFDVRRLFLPVVIALGLVACTHSDYMPNVIQLTPNGTAANPALESIKSSFTLIAVEDGYTGQFTAQTIVGECWVVQAPTTTSGAWTVIPQGVTCSGKPDTEQIQVKDTNSHSAITYIRSSE
jgi:hypothetical protein